MNREINPEQGCIDRGNGCGGVVDIRRRVGRGSEGVDPEKECGDG